MTCQGGQFRRGGAAGALLVLGSLGAAWADTVSARCDIYAKGSDTAAKVVACSFSQRQGFVAIDRADGVRHALRPQGAPGHYTDANGQLAIRSQGLGHRGQIYRLARETVYVYWDTAGLPGQAQPQPPRAEATVLPAVAAPPVPFDRTLTLQGIRFHVTSANAGAANELNIVPSGLAIDNAPIVRTVDGQVTGADVADLNADGSPEVYVYVRSTGPGAHGGLVAYSANRRKSLSAINLPALADEDEAARGYRGHDEFAVVERSLVRRFPVYRDGDPEAAPRGGVRQLSYRLEKGEASWQLRLDRFIDY